MTDRPCSRCGNPRDGAHQAYCKSCAAEYARSWRERYGQKQYVEYQKAWREANPDRVAEHQLRNHLKQYGLTVEEYREMQSAAGDRCPICDSQADLHIDHDHITGAVRGLICGPCNRGIGLLGDDANRLLAAAAYLIEHEPIFTEKR